MRQNLEISANRMLFFTKVILTFLVIGTLIFLNYMDLLESNRNGIYLNTVKEVYQQSKESKLEFSQFELNRLDWLQKADSMVYKEHEQARLVLVDILTRYGAFISRDTKGANGHPNMFILMTEHPFTPDSTENKKNELQHIINKNFIHPGPGGTVSDALDSFNIYARDDQADVLKGIDTAALVSRLDSLLLSGEREQIDSAGNVVNPKTAKQKLFGGYKTFGGLFLQNNNLYIRIKKQTPSQSAESADYIQAPVKTYIVRFPSVLMFTALDTIAVRTLYGDKDKQEELSHLYGSYGLNFIDNLSTEAFAKNNNAVSILGFDISRKWFPIAMFLVMLVIYFMLYKTMKEAKLSSLKILSGYEAQDALDFMLENKWLRFCLWVLSPLCLMFLVLYGTLIHYSGFIYGGLVGCGVLSVILGWVSYKISLQL